jgi:hypothetical protein
METESPLYQRLKFERPSALLEPIPMVGYSDQASVYYTVVPLIVVLYLVWPRFDASTFYHSDARQTLV